MHKASLLDDVPRPAARDQRLEKLHDGERFGGIKPIEKLVEIRIKDSSRSTETMVELEGDLRLLDRPQLGADDLNVRRFDDAPFARQVLDDPRGAFGRIGIAVETRRLLDDCRG